MKKILVVEDAHTLRKDIVEMLQFEGFEVDSAENGQDGLERARANRPDLIISDIMMPIMDGMKLLESLRNEMSTATIPLIFLTARTDRVDMRQGMELGAEDFVTKPFHAAELLATVHAQLKKKQVIEEETAKRMDEIRGNIILALPHELRTPLNAILGFSELLGVDADTIKAERIRDMAGHIQKAGKRLFALVDSYLLYAHLELMMTDTRRVTEARDARTIHPEHTINYSARDIAARYQRSDRLILDLEAIYQISVNEIYLKKIIDELVDNAFKFSTHEAAIRVTTFTRGHHYLIQIEDRGYGMTQEQVMQIGAYMQFSRRIQEQQGTGLGLVIARRLTDLHDGEFVIDSKPGVGTVVTVALPI